jgi:hypothetical protein
MTSKKAHAARPRAIDPGPPKDRREFERVGLPATAFAFDASGKELGRVMDISGGGLLLDPASAWARVALMKGQQLVVTVIEPGSANRTEINVEVAHIKSQTIGLRFL